MMSPPWPAMARLSYLAMTGSPLAPLVVLFTAVKSKVVLAASTMVLLPPAWLAALMSAIRSETVAALKVDGTRRSSSCSSLSRIVRRRGACGRGLAEADFQSFSTECHIVDLPLENGLLYNGGVFPGAQTERWGM